MITGLCMHNFKSWKDTGQVRIAPLTGLFGTNSSGKTAILQMLLLLKQTVESNDQSRVLNTGDDNSYVNIGTLYDAVKGKQIPNSITFSIEWISQEQVGGIFNGYNLTTDHIKFTTTIAISKREISVSNLSYSFYVEKFDADKRDIITNEIVFGIRQLKNRNKESNPTYRFFTEGLPKDKIITDIVFDLLEPDETNNPNIMRPVKCYGFPNYSDYFNDFPPPSAEAVLEFEKTFRSLYYLGPLRDYPHRTYLWSGQTPQDVGFKGERAIEALLAADKSVTEKVGFWLKELKLVHNFSVKPIARGRREHEVLVQSYEDGPEVPITDVGFGVSQLLPVLVLCYYVPEGSTVLLEQPEIHLHPSVQAGLADIFIDVIKNRGLQIILESHSEHLLQRLQRRIAEEQISNEETALYFCHQNNQGESQITTLELDQYGNIANWPENFFGDSFGDLAAMTEAAVRRRKAAKGK